MLEVGLNPYGLTYISACRAAARRAPIPSRGLEGFIALATELGARTLEICEPWLSEMTDDAVIALRERLAGLGMHTGRQRRPAGRRTARRCVSRRARCSSAKIIRIGADAGSLRRPQRCGEKWQRVRRHHSRAIDGMGSPARLPRAMSLRSKTTRISPARNSSISATLGGEGVGITFDTGNTFPVAEAPLDFTRAIAPHVRHVHLKDYRVQFTDEGYRLVRCAIGDGAVPFAEMFAILGRAPRSPDRRSRAGRAWRRGMSAFSRDDWWHGYPPKTAREFAACLAAAQRNRLPDDADYRTPWEREDDGSLVSYELDMIRRSAANMRELGLMKMEKI